MRFCTRYIRQFKFIITLSERSVLSVIISVCLSVCEQDYCKSISRFHWNLLLWLGLPIGRTGQRLVGLRSRYGFRITFPFSASFRIGNFIRFISISRTVTARFFMKLCEMTDADMLINPRHGRNPADIRAIQIRINPAIRFGIPDHFRLKFWRWRRFAFSERM